MWISRISWCLFAKCSMIIFQNTNFWYFLLNKNKLLNGYKFKAKTLYICMYVCKKKFCRIQKYYVFFIFLYTPIFKWRKFESQLNHILTINGMISCNIGDVTWNVCALCPILKLITPSPPKKNDLFHKKKSRNLNKIK